MAEEHFTGSLDKHAQTCLQHELMDTRALYPKWINAVSRFVLHYEPGFQSFNEERD